MSTCPFTIYSEKRVDMMDRKVYKMTAIFKFDCEYEYEYQYENRFLFVDVYPNYFKDGKTLTPVLRLQS